MSSLTLDLCLNALPKKFPFYHLGEVSLTPEATSADLPLQMEGLDSHEAIAFAIHGDSPMVLMILVEKTLDLSTYTELGNILASQMATRLNALISPPHRLSAERLEKILRASSKNVAHRTYLHQNSEEVVPIETLILGADLGAEGIGNA